MMCLITATTLDAIDEVTRICRLWGVDSRVPGLYVWQKKKRHFDEMAEDTLDKHRTALPNHRNIAANSMVHDIRMK